MLKLNGWGLRPWMEFQIDPASGRYEKRSLKECPTTSQGYAGFAQELKVTGLGTVLCAVFAHEGECFIRVGSAAWNLFEPGLAISHRQGFLHSELAVVEPGGKQVTYRYRRKDLVLLIIDTTYDDLDYDLAHLPAALPGLAERTKGDLLELWSREAVVPVAPGGRWRPGHGVRMNGGSES